MSSASSRARSTRRSARISSSCTTSRSSICESRHVTCCEALLRWRHPRNGIIEPDDFLCLAERTGAILDIGRWALSQACYDAKQWSHDVKVTVNLSLLQVENGDLPSIVRKALDAAELKPSRLKLEIGESMLDRREDCMRGRIEALRKLGIGIALDDFGKGERVARQPALLSLR